VIQVTLVAVVLVGFLLLGTSVGWTKALFLGTIFTLAVLPMGLSQVTTIHYGIAPGQPQVTTYGILVLTSAAFALLSRQRRLIPVGALMLSIYLLAFTTVAWQGNAGAIWSGALLLILALAGWTAGTYFGRVSLGDPAMLRWFASILLAAVVVQFVVSLVQFSGLPVVLLGRDFGSNSTGRIAGTLMHPGTLGKVLFLFLIPLLMLSRAEDKLTRRFAMVATILSVVLIALTLGRSNLAAVLTSVMLWALIAPRKGRIGNVLRVLLGLGAVAIPLASSYLDRITLDPTGGSRPELLSASYAQIADQPLFGIGPNNYVDVVSHSSTVTAITHLPVHNALLLVIAEIGIVGFLLFFLPIGRSWIQAVSARWRGSPGSIEASAILATAPGIVLLAVTGWGLMSTSTLVLWFFLTALVSSRVLPSFDLDNDARRAYDSEDHRFIGSLPSSGRKEIR